MAETVTDRSNRKAALSDFRRARDELAAAFGTVPNAALGYRPDGDEYALGGLVIHVTDVLERYTDILQSMKSADFGTVQQSSEPETIRAQTVARTRDGFAADERDVVFEQMTLAHDRLAALVRSLTDEEYVRASPVYYAGAAEPYDTAPASIVGWMTDHYRDHAQQAGDVLAGWRAERSASSE